MSGVMMMIIAIVVLGGAYLLYGRYLQNKWGIDPNAKTPAYEMEDGVDYVPADTNVVFGHQFASIAGAGPINGPIQAAIFGWLPVLLWILIGGVFFGAVQDFASMYASVKNKGRTIGYIIEEYIGKLGKKLFLLFCWLFCILVVAAFADVVALLRERKDFLLLCRAVSLRNLGAVSSIFCSLCSNFCSFCKLLIFRLSSSSLSSFVCSLLKLCLSILSVKVLGSLVVLFQALIIIIIIAVALCRPSTVRCTNNGVYTLTKDSCLGWVTTDILITYDLLAGKFRES